jgi:hypothetical protein
VSLPSKYEKKEVNLKEIKFCVPEATCKLNEMKQLGKSNGNGEENNSFVDTEQDKRDSKSIEGGEGQNCLVSGKKTKCENITGIRGRRCQRVPLTHINSVTSYKAMVINPGPQSEQAKYNRILTRMRKQENESKKNENFQKSTASKYEAS